VRTLRGLLGNMNRELYFVDTRQSNREEVEGGE
jgi:hypothetical protein